MRIILVCTGNTCRSPMAAALLRRAAEEVGLEGLEISSAGLDAPAGSSASPHSVEAMRRRGLDISGHTSRRLTAELVDTSDLILVMTRRHKERLISSWPAARDKVFTLREFAKPAAERAGVDIAGDDVADPIGGTMEVYEQTAGELALLADLAVRRLLHEKGERSLRVIIGNDHAGLALVEEITRLLDKLGHRWQHVGTFTAESADYPDYAVKVARAVAAGEFDRGILVCGTGIGMSIAANKVAGVRASLCSEPYSAALARQHNDANVLCLGARVTGPDLGREIVRVWLTTEFLGERHQRRLDKISSLEKER